MPTLVKNVQIHVEEHVLSVLQDVLATADTIVLVIVNNRAEIVARNKLRIGKNFNQY